MHTYAAKLERAEELVDVLFKLHSTSSPRIMAQLISASINTGTEEGAQRGWTVYNQMRDRLADDMTMEDFDSVSMDFLRNDKKDYALAVFRDMMIRGEERTKYLRDEQSISVNLKNQVTRRTGLNQAAK